MSNLKDVSFKEKDRTHVFLMMILEQENSCGFGSGII